MTDKNLKDFCNLYLLRSTKTLKCHLLPSSKDAFSKYSSCLMRMRSYNNFARNVFINYNIRISILSTYLILQIKYMVHQRLVFSLISVFYSTRGGSLSFCITSLIFNSAIAAAFLLGRNSVALGFSL